MRALRTVILIALAYGLLASPLIANDRKKTKALKGLANAVAGFASWCYKKELYPEAKELCKEALDLDPSHKAAQVLWKKVQRTGSVDEKTRKAYEKRFQSMGPKLAAQYLKLYKMKYEATEETKQDGYLLRAYYYDQKRSAGTLKDAWQTALNIPDDHRALRLLEGGQAIIEDEERAEALIGLQCRISATSPILQQVEGHEMKYYLSLPEGWQKDQVYAVMIAIAGHPGQWADYTAGYLRFRGSKNLIIATPQVLSVTNELDPKQYDYEEEFLESKAEITDRLAFDEEGILALADDLHKRFGAKEHFFLTGFSNGGILTYRLVVRHRERLVAVAPVAATFHPLEPEETPEPSDKDDLPILSFMGQEDPYRQELEATWEETKKYLKEQGFTNFGLENVPRKEHAPCFDKVMRFFTRHVR